MRINGVLLLLIMLVCGAVASPATAELVWEKRVSETTPPVAQDVVEVSFPFRNDGEKPITIRSVKPSCDCTCVVLAKQTYEPKESGVIIARVTRSDKQGDFVKTLLVTTDNELSSQVTLTIKLHLPAVLSIEPKYVFFPNQDLSPKRIVVKAAADVPVKLVSATSSRSEFQAKLETVDDGKEYVVTVAPTRGAGTAAADVSATIELRADVGAKEPRLFKAHAVMRKDESSKGGRPRAADDAPRSAKSNDTTVGRS